MNRWMLMLVAVLALGTTGVGYAAGKIDIPESCDPADTLMELEGQWGAKVQDSDCFGGNGAGVRVIDNDYAFRQHNCVVYRTNNGAQISIRFEDKKQLVVTSPAVTESQAASTAACGPIKVNFRTMNAT